MHAVVQRSDGHPDIHFPNGGVTGPDARLIAAAPEMLEALELIANTGMDARQCMLTARAAIKKAIGDTP